LAGRVTDQEIAAAAAAEGVHLAPLSPLYAGPPRAQGLLLGFAGFTEAHIQAAMPRLGGLMARLARE
jgi:GntR family transcriptional regulator/MocR family aminotransferase